MAQLLAALSGGVDSAVAAARAIDAGHQVIGVHLTLTTGVLNQDYSSHCSSLEEARDARQIASHLGIEFLSLDAMDDFRRVVMDDFVAEYARGRTPNPCLRCNATIKFPTLCDHSVALGYDGVITGHYAQLHTREDGLVELHRGFDADKDQSYVLGVLTQEQLKHCHFPLGGSTKQEVRRQARERGIPVADKPDSTDICFIPRGRTADFLEGHIRSSPGQIRDEQGQVLGHHRGIHGFTIGQRKGLRLGIPADDGHPRYVLRLEADTGEVIVGPKEHLKITHLRCSQPVWCTQPPADPFDAGVQLRAHAQEIPARIWVSDMTVLIDLMQPAYGIAPGQTAVIYDKTRVLGSTTIDSTSTDSPHLDPSLECGTSLG
jgi:tRNA-specific 2-thiouridylase